MKNLKIRTKLMLSFAIVLVLTIATGVVGIRATASLSHADWNIYSYNVLGLDALSSIRENFALQRIAYRNMLLYNLNELEYRQSITTLKALESEMDSLIQTYRSVATDKTEIALFNSFINDYNGGFKNLKEQANDLTSKGAADAKDEVLTLINTSLTERMISYLNDCYKQCTEVVHAAIESNTQLANRSTIIQCIILTAAAALTIILSIYLSAIIGKPLSIMTNYFSTVASTGDTTLRQEDLSLIEQCANYKDEINVCVYTTSVFIGRVLEIGRVMELIADGDLTADIVLLSDQDTMGLSLKKMLENLNHMFGEINTATVQVSVSSRYTANGSQNLAQGATQQASAVEELSASINHVSQNISENAQMAINASGLAESIKHDAERGSVQMDHMLAAVKEIEEASRSISKVIKVIDDIAFQTNILALNAAVEAARAGQHGKGFAVVAEEVRNLAAKSAEAAKTTGGLIANSMEKAELGAKIAAETATSLSEIVKGINESGRIVAEIALSSEKQAGAISQINKGVEQVGQVIHQNSATAQESAAASEQMSEQASILEKLAARFKVKNLDYNHPAQNQHDLANADPNRLNSSHSSGIGKY